MLAHISGTVDQELLLSEERISGRREPDPQSPNQRQVVVIRSEKATLAEIAHRLGRKALQELAALAKPETLLVWYRKLIAQKFDGSRCRKLRGRPRVDEEIERRVARMAKEDPTWGYDRIVGAMANLGFKSSGQTEANILRRHDISLALQMKRACIFVRRKPSETNGIFADHSGCRAWNRTLGWRDLSPI
jgi:putative transposase